MVSVEKKILEMEKEMVGKIHISLMEGLAELSQLHFKENTFDENMNLYDGIIEKIETIEVIRRKFYSDWKNLFDSSRKELFDDRNRSTLFFMQNLGDKYDVDTFNNVLSDTALIYYPFFNGKVNMVDIFKKKHFLMECES